MRAKSCGAYPVTVLIHWRDIRWLDQRLRRCGEEKQQSPVLNLRPSTQISLEGLRSFSTNANFSRIILLKL